MIRNCFGAFCGGVFLLCASVCGAQEVVLSLEESLQIALRDNRDILLKKEDILKAQSLVKQASADRLPSVTLVGQRSQTDELLAKSVPATSGQVAVEQPLYKGGKITSTIKAKRYGLEGAEAALEAGRLSLVFNVKKAFYTLVLSGQYVQLNRSMLENARQHLALLRARYESGEASESEVLAATSSLARVQDAYTVSLGQHESAMTLLRSLLYLDDGLVIRPQTAELACEPKEVALDEGFIKALSLRPELKQYDAQTNAARAQVGIEKAEGRPSITASWDYYNGTTTGAVTTTSRRWNDYSVLGISLSWPVFDGWATKAKVEGALVALKQAQLSKERLVKDIVSEVRNAYVDFQNSLSLLSATEQEGAVYKDNLTVVEEKSSQGLASTLDLDDARLKYDIARFNKTQAVYDYLVAKAGFEKAIGG